MYEARKIAPSVALCNWRYSLRAVTRRGSCAGLEIPLIVEANSLHQAIRSVRAIRTYPSGQYSLRVVGLAKFIG